MLALSILAGAYLAGLRLHIPPDNLICSDAHERTSHSRTRLAEFYRAHAGRTRPSVARRFQDSRGALIRRKPGKVVHEIQGSSPTAGLCDFYQ